MSIRSVPEGQGLFLSFSHSVYQFFGTATGLKTENSYERICKNILQNASEQFYIFILSLSGTHLHPEGLTIRKQSGNWQQVGNISEPLK